MTQRGVSRFLPNTAALVTSAATTTVLTVVQVKILAAHLPMDVFGQFVSLRGLSLLIAMLAANGLPQLLIRFLPVHESRGNVRRALGLISVSLAGCAGLFAILAVTAIGFQGRVFGDISEMSQALQFWFLVTTLGVAIKLVVYGGFSGLRRMIAQTVIELLTLIAQVGWIYARREDLTLVGLFQILGVVALSSVAVALPWLIVRAARDARGRARTLDADNGGVSYGGYWLGATGLSVVALAFTDVDRYILSHVLALEILSLFHVGSRIVRLANRFLAVPVLAFQPEVSRVDAEGRGEVIAFTTRVFLKFNAIISLLVTGVIIVYGGELIVLIANPDYLAAMPLLIVLALSIPLTTLTAPLTAVMKALDRVRDAFTCDLIYALAYVPLLIVLGRWFGLIGAAAAQVAACTLQLFVAARKSRVDVGLGEVARSVLKTVLCAIVAFAIPELVSGAGGGMALKIAAFVPGAVVFRWLIRVSQVVAREERDRLNAMFGQGWSGRALRWLLG